MSVVASGGPAPPYRFGSNLANVPAWTLASLAFHERPARLQLRGVRERAAELFARLAGATDALDAGRIFSAYMDEAYLKPRPGVDPAQRRHRATYRELLAGWGVDSNARQGAVLKGWVESRFGFAPTFHKAPLARFPSPAWATYLEEKASSLYCNNDIDAQLDLLYEYAQWFVQRFTVPGRTFVRLWRGVNGFAEHSLVSGRLRDRACVLRMNNLVSFSLSRERADEFGDWILEVDVPTTKLLFFQGLLPGSPLAGEGEALAIGGDYRVKASYA